MKQLVLGFSNPGNTAVDVEQRRRQLVDLVRSGKDVEKAVLARGLRYHLEDRVLLNGGRTVVFRS